MADCCTMSANCAAVGGCAAFAGALAAEIEPPMRQVPRSHHTHDPWRMRSADPTSRRHRRLIMECDRVRLP